MKYKILFIFVFLVSLSVGIYFLWKNQTIIDLNPPSSEPSSLVSVSLRLKWITTAGFAGDYLAVQDGFFKQEGLLVDVRTGGPQTNPLVLVPSGTDDFGVTGADGLLLARANGVPVVAIAAAFQRNASGFIAKTESGLSTPDKWIGKKVGIIPGNDTETIYRALMKKLNIDRESLIEIPIGFSLTPFLTGQIDIQPGYITNQPNLLKNKGIDVTVIDPADYGVFMIGNVYFTTEDMLRDHPELVRSFLRAVISGWNEAIAHPDRAINALLNADSKLNPENQLVILKDTIQYVIREDDKVGLMDKLSWQKTHDTLLELGILKKAIDLEAAFTNEFQPY